METPLKPGPLLVVVTAILVAGCLLLIAGLLSITIREWNLGVFTVMMLMTFCLVVVAWLHYAATYRSDATPAESAVWTSCMIGIMAGALGFFAILDYVQSRGSSEQANVATSSLIRGLIFFVYALTGAAGAWLYHRRAHRLRASGCAHPTQQFTIRELMLITAAVAVVFGLATLGMHATPAPWLPSQPNPPKIQPSTVQPTGTATYLSVPRP